MDRKNLCDELHVKGDCAIIGDLHCPQHDLGMLDLLKNKCKSHKIKSLIINGDFMNMDAFSSFDRKQLNADWDTETKSLKEVGNFLADIFDTIYLCEGNHDIRLMKATKYTLTYYQVLKMVLSERALDKFKITSRDYIILNKICRVCHPREYARTIGFKAKQIGLKYGMDTIVGHSHFGSLTEEDGRTYMDGFCMLNPEAVEYSVMNTTSFTKWNQGFILSVGGVYLPISPTDPIYVDDIFKRRGSSTIRIRKLRW